MAESSQNGWKHCGKRRNGSLQAISPFPTVVSKDFVLQTRKNQGLFRKKLTHSQMTNFRLFQTERVAEDNFRFDENGRKLTKLVEKTVGKGEIARYEQFLLFPQCFQKACFPGASKGVIVWEWVKIPNVESIFGEGGISLSNNEILDLSELKAFADDSKSTP